MTDRDLLIQALSGERAGFTRTQLAHRLRMDDRALRDLIAEVVTSGEECILPPTITGGTYRLARQGEHDLVNRANAEDRSRAMSSLGKAKGRLLAFERKFQAGALFLDNVPDLDAA